MKDKMRNDLLLIGGLLLLAAVFLTVLMTTRRSGAQVTVTVDGSVTETFPLNTDRTYPIETQWGTNWLVIEDGQARISQADCPDELCVHGGAIQWDGQSVVCLPHRVVVSITGGADSGVDAVTGG